MIKYVDHDLNPYNMLEMFCIKLHNTPTLDFSIMQ